MFKDTWSSIALVLFIFFFIISDYGLYKTIENESNHNITVTVKALMLDHVNAYILQPLTEYFVQITRFPYLFPFIHPNHVSYFGVFSALIAAHLVLKDSLLMKRFGVIAFFVRQFMDDLDGYLARCRMGIDAKKQVSLPNSTGYYVDGICDGIGTVVFWYATVRSAYSRRQSISNKSNVLLSNVTYKLFENNTTQLSNYRKIIKYYLLLLVQIGLSSFFWNIYLIQYHQLLDPCMEDGFNNRTPSQEEIFKSSLTLVIMWSWRLINPHALVNYFLVSIWFNRTTQYAKHTSPYIFYIIIFLSSLSWVHLNDIKHRLAVETFS